MLVTDKSAEWEPVESTRLVNKLYTEAKPNDALKDCHQFLFEWQKVKNFLVTNNTSWWQNEKINSTEVIKFNNLNLTEFYNATRPEIKMIHCVSAGLGDCSKFWRVGSISKHPHCSWTNQNDVFLKLIKFQQSSVIVFKWACMTSRTEFREF